MNSSIARVVRSRRSSRRRSFARASAARRDVGGWIVGRGGDVIVGRTRGARARRGRRGGARKSEIDRANLERLRKISVTTRRKRERAGGSELAATEVVVGQRALDGALGVVETLDVGVERDSANQRAAVGAHANVHTATIDGDDP